MSPPYDERRDRSQELILLGQLHGKMDTVLESNREQNARLDSIDARLRLVEQKAAVAGAVSGGAISIGVALLIEGVKSWMGAKGLR